MSDRTYIWSRYCLNCTELGQLILRKIIKIVATRCQILRLKCTKSYSAPPELDLRKPTSKGREGEGTGREGGEGKRELGKGEEGEGHLGSPTFWQKVTPVHGSGSGDMCFKHNFLIFPEFIRSVFILYYYTSG